MNLGSISMFAQYNQWANRILYDAVTALPAADFAKPRPTTFGSIERTLGHCCAVALIFQAHLQRNPHGFTVRNVGPGTSFETMRRMQQDVDAWYASFADATLSAAPYEVIEFVFLDGKTGAMTGEEMLLHVVNHNTFHRGFVTDILNQLLESPPVTDLTVFLRDVYRKQR